jgi:hypothetical protein
MKDKNPQGGTMKTLLLVLVVLSFSQRVLAGDMVSVPWNEFEKLYRESIVRDVMKTRIQPAKQKEPLVYTLEEATYNLTIGKESARGEVLLSGEIVAGDPKAIDLFGTDIIIARTDQLTGGTLLVDQEGDGGVSFLPDGKKEFQVMLAFLIQPQEDTRSKLVSFSIPPALKNSLSIELSPDTTLLDKPGIADNKGTYHFSARRDLEIRYREKEDLSATSLVDIDSFTRVHIQGKRAIMTASFAPAQSLPDSFVLQMQDEAQYVSSTLKSSWIKQKNGSYEIAIPADEKESFSIQFAVEESADTGFSFTLPRIQQNNGKEGDFILEEPDDAQVSIAGKGLVSGIPVAKLHGTLVHAAGNEKFYRHIPSGEPLRLNVERFKSVATPPIVLDAQYFFASFEENGNVLSVLVADIPAEVGPRLQLKAIPNAEIWSLKVNERKRKVYTNDENTWIIPLADGQTSRVELALLQKGTKLGLHGRLETSLPYTGLPSRTLCVGIALPERVQLLSMEGPVSPAPGDTWRKPVEFIGKPYFFSRSFYKGEGMKLALSYKEPVEKTQQ